MWPEMVTKKEEEEEKEVMKSGKKPQGMDLFSVGLCGPLKGLCSDSLGVRGFTGFEQRSSMC